MRGSPGLLSRLAPVAFVAGLTLLGLGLLLLSLAATDGGETRFGDGELTTRNGTATLAFVVPVGFGDETVLDGSFRFPERAGHAYVVRCADYEALREGRPPRDPEMSVGGPSGSFRIGGSPFGILDAGPERRDPATGRLCPYRFVVLQWTYGDGDPEANRPEVELALRSSLLEGPTGAVVLAFGLLGTALALAGGLAWGARLNRERALPPAPDDESAAETLLAALERSGAWLERTRRYLLLAGVLGLFLWYPILLPWAWNVSRGPGADATLPWVVPLGVLAILLALTVVWAREFLRLDRELTEWRDRMARLRAREAALLDGPPSEPQSG